jgi:subtilisin family serine protease
MPTPQERLASAARFFFETAVPQASGKSFAQLTDPKVHVGAYLPHGGAAVQTTFGQSITPKFALQSSPAVAVTNGQPQITAPPAAGAGPVRHLLYLRQAADLKADTEEEIRRVMADVESFAPIFSAAVPMGAERVAPVPTGDGPPPPPTPAPASAPAPETATAPAAGTAPPPGGGEAGLRASEWARALVAARDGIGDDLSALTAVPPALQALAPDVEALKTVLWHFFTYDAVGKRYPRWAGAGRDGTSPAQLSPDYKRENVRELQLERENLYLYGVTPEALLAPGGTLDRTAFREFVLRFDETGDEARPWLVSTLHSARLRQDAGGYEDFVFFFAENGTGPAVPVDARAKMAATLQTFLQQVTDAGEGLEQFLQNSAFTVKIDDVWHLVLSVLFEGSGVTVPDGVIAPDTDGWGVVQTPLDKIVPLALTPAVKYLEPVRPGKMSLDLSRAEVNFPALETKIAAAKRGGAGVLVGIIDTGIDGSHPAFAGRIHSVWDQDNPALVTGKTPRKNNPDNDAYKLLNFGVEVTKTSSPHTVANSQDPNGHGTHVSSIAAGAEVKDAAGTVLVPAGYAPNATIVVVRAIATQNQSNWLLGVLYIFNKAKELGCPCVINMSFGHQDHAHDGTDTESLALFARLTDKKKYLPGRVVVASAGNQRSLPNGTGQHCLRKIPRDIDFGGVKVIASVDLGTNLDTTSGERLMWDKITIWVKNPTSGTGNKFPLQVMVYRKKTASTFDSSEKVSLGKSGTASFAAVNTKVTISTQLADAANGDFNIDVMFESRDGKNPITLGRWHVLVVNGSKQELDAHVWLPRGKSSFADFTEADRTHLTGAPATSAAAISVASCNSRTSWKAQSGTTFNSAEVLHDVSSFSSMGPLRESSKSLKTHHGITHDVNAVDITAPGHNIIAARSSQLTIPAKLAWQIINARAVIFQGTSMASPAVTGLVANLLAEESTLTLPDVLTRLKKAAAVPAASKFQPKTPPGGSSFSEDWGYGLVKAGDLKP